MDMKIKSTAYGTEYCNIEYRHAFNHDMGLSNKAIVFYLKPMNLEIYKSNSYLGFTITLFGIGVTFGFGGVNVN